MSSFANPAQGMSVTAGQSPSGYLDGIASAVTVCLENRHESAQLSLARIQHKL